MKIVAISDLHGYLPELPACDVVCISGDIVPLGIQSKPIQSFKWLVREFRDWADSLKCEWVVVIGGNHDFIFQQLQEKRNISASSIDYLLWDDSNIIYLQDNAWEYKGKVFYGTPWCPNLRNWAFYKNSADLTETFNGILDTHIDVLLTHCPPMVGTQGKVLQGGSWNFDQDFGCEELRDAIKNKNIDWVLSGHIHSGNHKVEQYDNTKYVNVSIKDEEYQVCYQPFEFEI